MIKIRMFLPGLLLLLLLNANPACAADYKVAEGDSLWKISQSYGINIDKIMEINNLKDDRLTVGQVLKLDNTSKTTAAQALTANQKDSRTPPGAYIVQPGDTLGGIAQRFGTTAEGIRRLNNIQGDLIYAGQTLSLNGSSVSRGSVERPKNAEALGESNSSRHGRLIDWYKEGINILKPGLKFTATDTRTGKTMRFAVLGGSDHCDVEPLTKEDTDIMLSLFSDWTWTPRPVCVQAGGKAIAASLSGMPHTDIENITDNNVTGHFDMYLFNSQPHGSGISKSYVQQHCDAVLQAAD
ncbi:LysM peptidoglycan-binding domain-containing protein [Desulfoscipio sp. XC116]|uniref:LysM peptidoglycan-binding domain-containing protein n=1 Tax=Desulfoscipio sp. XC116 TaxID=3144975 RepID=UPI00325BCB2C